MRFFYGLVLRLAWWGNISNQVIRKEETIAVENGEIRALTYVPATKTSRPLPIIVFYHGGGFVLGDIDVYDPICRNLCEKTGYIVVSINYRLAPEYPFPTAPNDCLTGLGWVISNVKNLGGDAHNIFVAGDSAGGNLAAITAIQAKELFPTSIRGQILLYPVVDHYTSVTKSYIENAKGQGLSRNAMIWFWDQYLKDGTTRHDLATPLTATDLSGLPPALVMTAELDPLRDEGNAYATRLLKSNVEVQHSIYQGEKHGFCGLGPTKVQRKALSEIIKWIEQILYKT